MKIGLIGAAGFLGVKLEKILKHKNFEVFSFDIKNSNDSKNYIDVCRPIEKSKFDTFDAIINLAAEHRDDVKPTSQYDIVNVDGAHNVCNTASLAEIKKIIFTSSVAVYGFAEPNTGEDGEKNYFNDYGRTKNLAEQVYINWYNDDPINRSLVIIRPTVIFGEGNRGNVFNLLKQIAANRFIMFGNGKNIKSMAYVDNVAAFIEFSLSFKQGLHIYNYVDKPDFDMNALVSVARKTLFDKNNVGLRFPAFLGVSIGYIADLVAKVIGKSLPVSSIRVKKFMGTTQFSSSVSKTGFVAPVTLQEGLSRTLRYEFLEDNSMNKTFDTE